MTPWRNAADQPPCANRSAQRSAASQRGRRCSTVDIVARDRRSWEDAVVLGVRFSGWQTSREGDRTVKFEIRKAFKKYGLEPTGELFDRAYAYVAEHY